ncbi:hypothetical protein [Mesorhizobium sp. CAU 1732]|uniref:hypothetical protein n=1 Tax=Mesorhizobium sp. CAU 1732 TaxID=3140358 RepID=UPI003260C241
MLDDGLYRAPPRPGASEPPRTESVVSQQFECRRRENMNSIIYIVGLVVIVVAILSFIGIG